jgi:hypothetical protein
VPVVGGLVWGVALVGALLTSAPAAAILLAAVAAVATASGMRSSEPRARRRRSPSALKGSLVRVAAIAASILAPLSALGGTAAGIAVLVVAVGAVAALVFTSGYASSVRPLRSAAGRFVAASAPTIAATSVVLARDQGATLAVALVGATLAYDAAAFVMGNGRTATGGPAGVLFGALSVAVVAIVVAAVMNPPFSGGRSWVVFGGLAASAALGVRLCEAVGAGDRLPAVRRLDSCWLAGPFWVLAAALLLNR